MKKKHILNQRSSIVKVVVALFCVSALLAITSHHATAQLGNGPGAARTGKFSTVYVRFGDADEGLLFEPSNPGPKARIALMYSHPGGDNFDSPIGRELASRGYRALLVNHHGGEGDIEKFAPGLSRAVQYLRTLSGVQRVVYFGHSGGGMLAAFYANVAANGVSSCQGAEKIYPCRGVGLTGLAKPDGIVLLDSNLGAPYRMESIDPAVSDDGSTMRSPALDMFAAGNGFDTGAKRATYSAAFAKRFYAGQKGRTDRLIAKARARLRAIEQGSSAYSDDEPFVVRGAKLTRPAAALHYPDPEHYLARLKKPHLLLKADGTRPEVIVPSVRPPIVQYAKGLQSLQAWTLNTTVREFLSQVAIRTTPDYAVTADDIVGVDWRSSMLSTAGNAEGIAVPALVMVMTCNDHMVPGEIIFDHLGSKDKTFAAVEGALHEFVPCKPEYGDTQKRMFDFIDGWLGKAGRF